MSRPTSADHVRSATQQFFPTIIDAFDEAVQGLVEEGSVDAFGLHELAVEGAAAAGIEDDKLGQGTFRENVAFQLEEGAGLGAVVPH